MEKFVEFSQYAKVNLSLNVLGVKDGFHLLEMVMAPINLSDFVRMSLREDGEITVTYLTGEHYANDNALRSAKLIQQRYSLPGVDIEISKGVPEGVGLGGSAVDSAAIARGYEMLCNVEMDNEFLLSLGGDVPFLKYGKPAIVRGRGEIITPIELKDLHLALAYGNRPFSTKEIFETYDKVGGKNSTTAERFLSTYKPQNALEKSAFRKYPFAVLTTKLGFIRSGFKRVVMTGAGAGFISFEEDEKKFEKLFKKLNKKIFKGVKLQRLTIIKE